MTLTNESANVPTFLNDLDIRLKDLISRMRENNADFQAKVDSVFGHIADPKKENEIKTQETCLAEVISVEVSTLYALVERYNAELSRLMKL